MRIPGCNRKVGTCLKPALALLVQLASGCAVPPGEPPGQASAAVQGSAVDAAWLDQAPANWNRRMAPLPRPVSSLAAEQFSEHCRFSARQPIGPAEHALARAGWKLFGIVLSYGDTQIITAMSGTDGMCRPLGYQAFVYSEGRYAGTLSPVAMNSRTDGALTVTRPESPMRIVAEFLRYRETDPLCCPTRTSRVTYEVSRDDAPLVTPIDIDTKPAG